MICVVALHVEPFSADLTAEFELPRMDLHVSIQLALGCVPFVALGTRKLEPVLHSLGFKKLILFKGSVRMNCFVLGTLSKTQEYDNRN